VGRVVQSFSKGVSSHAWSKAGRIKSENLSAELPLTTDHPVKPTVTLSVLILPEAATGDE
jgi:hypothetical protein